MRTCSTRFVTRWRSGKFEDDFTMLVGPARNSDLLELGVLDIETDDPLIVHAMRARPKFLPPQ